VRFKKYASVSYDPLSINDKPVRRLASTRRIEDQDDIDETLATRERSDGAGVATLRRSVAGDARWKPVNVEDLKVGMTFDLAEKGPG
jgi:hypothetical protein